MNINPFETEKAQFEKMLTELGLTVSTFEALIGSSKNNIQNTIAREKRRNNKMPRFLMQMVALYEYSRERPKP